MPPESCHGYFVSESDRPTASNASSTSLARSSFGTFFSLSGNSTLPRTVSQGNSERAYSWNTTAMPFGGPLTISPSIFTVPEVGGSSPAMERRSVVLPAPEGPTMQTSSPAFTSKVRLRMASVPPLAPA